MNRAERRKYLKDINTPAKYEGRIREVEKYLRREYEDKYKKSYEEQLENAIDIFMMTIVYTLHFNESTKFGNKRIQDFMDDLIETVDMFRRGEAKPEDYEEQLKKEGIKIIGNSKEGNK